MGDMSALEQAEGNQRGAVLPLMAILLVVLMGAAAMAVDLGWLYWQSIEIQHGADAAALAGVVYEPDLRTQAKSEAVAAAKENGYDDANTGTTVTVIDFVDDDTAVVNDSMLRVTIQHEVNTFFLKVFGLSDINIARSAVAEYIQPLAMGSPEPTFGDDPATGNEPGFWASVQTNYTGKTGGDRYGSLCLHDGFGADCKQDTSSGSGGTQQGLNPEARLVTAEGTAAATGGYTYGIEVADGASGLTVEIFNGPVYAVRKWDKNGSPAPPVDAWGNKITGNFAGDTKYRPNNESWGWTLEGRTFFALYGPDPTPADSTDGNELLCVVYYDERLPQWDANEDDPPNSSAYDPDFGSMGWDDSWLEFDDVDQAILDAMWDDMSNSLIADFSSAGCSGSFDRGPGIYLLRVYQEYDDTGATSVRDSWRGANKYSLRASTTAGDQPTISAVGDMSISASRTTAATEFYLARVDQRYAGRNLIIEIWDVGDFGGSSDTGYLQILDGSGSATPVDCEWSATNGDSGSGSCEIETTAGLYNDELITIIVELADDYTCSGNGCWWKFNYSYAGQVKDTTTWTAYIDGNPLRLVE